MRGCGEQLGRNREGETLGKGLRRELWERDCEEGVAGQTLWCMGLVGEQGMWRKSCEGRAVMEGVR